MLKTKLTGGTAVSAHWETVTAAFPVFGLLSDTEPRKHDVENLVCRHAARQPAEMPQSGTEAAGCQLRIPAAGGVAQGRHDGRQVDAVVTAGHGVGVTRHTPTTDTQTDRKV